MDTEEAIMMLRGVECLIDSMAAEESIGHIHTKEALWVLAKIVREATDAIEAEND